MITLYLNQKLTGYFVREYINIYSNTNLLLKFELNFSYKIRCSK